MALATACVNSSPAITWLVPPAEADKSPTNSPERSTDPPHFEFRLDDPVAMLPADELFSDGKLVPAIQMAALRSPTDSTAEIRSPETVSCEGIKSEMSGSEPYLFSPKAPRCSSRWRELLGLKKLQNPSRSESTKSSRTTNPRSIRLFLNRNPKSSEESSLNLPLLRDSESDSSLNLPLFRDSESDSSLNLPLLRDSESESSLSSSRLSLSSSSDLPGLSSQVPVRAGGGPTTRVRASRPVRRVSAEAESPRMNSSGKVVFNGGSLQRCPSSRGSFNGNGVGASSSFRVRPRAMQRSYSSTVVRVNPVLNVPVCSRSRGSGKPVSVFGFFSSSSSSSSSASSSGNNKKEKLKDKDSSKSSSCSGKTKTEKPSRE